MNYVMKTHFSPGKTLVEHREHKHSWFLISYDNINKIQNKI